MIAFSIKFAAKVQQINQMCKLFETFFVFFYYLRLSLPRQPLFYPYNLYPVSVFLYRLFPVPRHDCQLVTSRPTRCLLRPIYLTPPRILFLHIPRHLYHLFHTLIELHHKVALGRAPLATDLALQRPRRSPRHPRAFSPAGQ